VGGVSPVSVCGLYVYATLRLRYPATPSLRVPRALLCRAVGMSHVVSSREWARGLHYRPQPQGWLADASNTHLFFIFISCIARSTQREYTARVLLRCAHTQCMLHSLPMVISLNFKLAHVQIVPDAPHDDCALCATRSVTVTAQGHLPLPNFKMAPLLNNLVTT